MNLRCSGNAGIGWIGLCVKCCFLVRILTIAHFLSFNVLYIVGIGKITRCIASITSTKVISNHAVITSRVFKRLYHQLVARFIIELPLIGLHFFSDCLVIASIHHNRNITMIFSRRAHHSGPTDINIFNSPR